MSDIQNHLRTQCKPETSYMLQRNSEKDTAKYQTQIFNAKSNTTYSWFKYNEIATFILLKHTL